jgi:hypothetical protein
VDEMQLAIAYWVPKFHPEMVAKAICYKKKKKGCSGIYSDGWICVWLDWLGFHGN